MTDRSRVTLALVAVALAACGGWSPGAHASPTTGSGDGEAVVNDALPPLPRDEPLPAAAETDPSRHTSVEPLSAAQPADAALAPAVRYASLSADSCIAELTRRGVAFTRVDSARGVLAPLRIDGPIGGVSFHGPLPPARRTASPYEIIDCRLALALFDFASILVRHEVVEAIHMSVYRPPPKAWPSAKIGSRHDGALAIDIGSFVRRDGRVLNVERDFHGRLGARTCVVGGGEPSPPTADSAELHAILCEAASARVFNVALSPNYNRPHHNHFHLEVTAGVRWFIVH